VSDFQPSVTEEQYKEYVQKATDKDLSDMDTDLENAITLVIARHRQMYNQGIEVDDPMLRTLLDRLTIIQRNRNNLAHMVESIAWYEEYNRNR
jgi:hypothetical protein